MEEKTNKAVINLMQIVVDKLDAISKDLNKNDNPELNNLVIKNNDDLKNLIKTAIENQSRLGQLNLDTGNKIKDCIIENKTTPSVNNYTEYSLFGNKSQIKPIGLIIIIFSLVITWSSIKYLPPYFTEKSLLNKENKEYQIFYNYVYLKQYKNDEILRVDKILNKIEQKDSLFMNEYHQLLDSYHRDIRKQELQEELNSINNGS